MPYQQVFAGRVYDQPSNLILLTAGIVIFDIVIAILFPLPMSSVSQLDKVQVIDATGQTGEAP